MRLLPLAAIAASLALAAPAWADPGATTVGAPQVITDPSGQVDTTPAPAPQTTQSQPPDTSTQPTTTVGDTTPPPLHVTSQLIGPRPAPSGSSGTAATASSGPVASTSSAPASSTASAQPATSASSAKQLPFTGIAAWQIAAAGLALIAAGGALWRIGEQQ